MRRFRDGKTKVLVATDVVGRGIDVTTISHIINYDVPQFCDDYVHRVGRTGRMGREGVAFTFVSPEEGNELTRIEMRINRLLKRDEIPGFVALAKPLPTEDFDAESGEPLEPPPPKPVFGRRTAASAGHCRHKGGKLSRSWRPISGRGFSNSRRVTYLRSQLRIGDDVLEDLPQLGFIDGRVVRAAGALAHGCWPSRPCGPRGP